MRCLTSEQLQFYNDNGYIQLSGLIPDDVLEEVAGEYDRIFQLKNNAGLEGAWLGDDMKEAADNTEYSVQSIHNLQFHSAAFSRLLHGARLLDACEDVMAAPDILLHHTKAHWKPPLNGAPFLIHQDYQYFPYKRDSMVAVFVHLDRSGPENGGLCVYPGSHRLGPLADHGVASDGGREFHWVDPKKYPLSGATAVRAERGDVVIFSYLLLHGSYANRSARPRRMFLAQLLAAGDEPLRDTHKSPGQGWVLRGKNDYRKACLAERFLH